MSCTKVDLKQKAPSAEGPEVERVLVPYKPDSWQGKALAAMKANRYEIATNFKPIIEEALLDIGQQLEVPEVLAEVARREKLAERPAQ